MNLIDRLIEDIAVDSPVDADLHPSIGAVKQRSKAEDELIYFLMSELKKLMSWASPEFQFEPIKFEHIKLHLLKFEPLKLEPLKTDSLKSESLKSELFKFDSLKSEQLKFEQLKFELLKSE